MSSELLGVCFDADRPDVLVRFWGGLLDRPVDGASDSLTLPSPDGAAVGVRFRPSVQAKVAQNRLHFDLTSTSLDDQQASVRRALDLGGAHVDVGQLPDEDHVVLADPDGNEFCVLEPGNNFLAGCGFTGALACDGSEAVGRFWAAALDWPLVWDQDEETAIQSPRGGTKITWGGPPMMPRAERDRLHLDLVTEDLDAEIDRLVGLGAARSDSPAHDPGAVVLTDPDDNEFCLIPRH